MILKKKNKKQKTNWPIKLIQIDLRRPFCIFIRMIVVVVNSPFNELLLLLLLLQQLLFVIVIIISEASKILYTKHDSLPPLFNFYFLIIQ